LNRLPHSTPAECLDVIIIGAGFSGVGMGIALRNAGIEDFVILEKAPASGGVWRDNTYPGAACDVPSLLYSFSFERDYRWSRLYSPREEIDLYLSHCIEKYRLTSKIRYGAEVKAARFDGRGPRWCIEFTSGEPLSARNLITAMGQLNRPAWPDIPGLHEFRGTIFHSACWDHSFDLNDKHVAVIGTGASAIQFVPQIVKKVGRLVLFQRSAPYVLPKVDHALSKMHYRLFDVMPMLYSLARFTTYLSHEFWGIGFFTRFRFANFLIRVIALLNLRFMVRDRRLRGKLMPQHAIGCKRILVSGDYYPAVSEKNVDLVTSGIRRIGAEHIESNDGTSHRVDAIILGTGFQTTGLLAPIDLRGRGDRRISDAWRQSPEAYLGMTAPGFPNLFMLYGPNTHVTHNSAIYMIESQIRYVMKALQMLREQPGSCMEVKESVHNAFNDRLQRALGRSVWMAGCRNWYVDASGKVINNWSGFTFTYRHQTRKVRREDYDWNRKDAVKIDHKSLGVRHGE
jgi:cation diffusion facilitator CzcD-associated flavoprotein CzcO